MFYVCKVSKKYIFESSTSFYLLYGPNSCNSSYTHCVITTKLLYVFKWAILGLFFFIFVFSTTDLWIGSDRSSNWATTTAFVCNNSQWCLESLMPDINSVQWPLHIHHVCSERNSVMGALINGAIKNYDSVTLTTLITSPKAFGRLVCSGHFYVSLLSFKSTYCNQWTIAFLILHVLVQRK